MRIGELAKAVGIKPSAIRYYEQIGLIGPAERAGSGYRDYGEADERRLRLVVQARMLSIPLSEVREFVDLAADGRCLPARAELLSALRSRLAETRRQIRELRTLQRELRSMCDHLTGMLAQPAADTPADSCSCLDAPRLPTARTGSRENRQQEGGSTHE